ncbi:MAG: FecR domain-containing protein [Verrucomicrobia bacterium]|nr:FecR domain-containing protein [Verrucomicrobiota bacterium]
MKLSFPSPEFDGVVAAVCHGTATEAAMRILNGLLRSNARARDEYLMRVELHARLASDPDLFSQKLADDMPPPLAGGRFESRAPDHDDSFDLHGCPLTSSPCPAQGEGARNAGERTTTPRTRLMPVLALAACLVVAAWGAWSLWFKQPASRIGAASTAVAMLTRVVEAEWTQDTGPIRVGSALEPGWLRLESGLAQVVFYSGTRLVIEGPAALQLVSPRELTCRSGRLLVEVPPPARGFRLKTDQLDVVDLGTAFGIDANNSRTEVHVFKGEVELLPRTAPKRSLGKGQAAVVTKNALPQITVARAQDFASMFEFHQRSLASEAFRYEQWQFASARLNQDPSLVVHLDFRQLSGVDWTLRNAAEGTQAAPDATVVGGQRAEGRWREKQALEFQSVNDRVRLAVPGEFHALTLSAWVSVKGLDRKFHSLFMCDGFEPGTIHWLIRNDGALGLTVFGAEPGDYQIMASPPVLAIDKFGLWLHLAVVLDGDARELVHYVNGTPVSRHALRLGPPFRIGAAELGNWNAHSGPNPAPVLIRNFSGALDEFELFSRALDDAEVRELHVKGKPPL